MCVYRKTHYYNDVTFTTNWSSRRILITIPEVLYFVEIDNLITNLYKNKKEK